MMPSVETTGPMERALVLRALPLFGGMRTSQLAALARLAEERTAYAGSVLQACGRPVRALAVLLEGAARIEHDGRVLARVEAPSAVGLLELLADRPSTSTVVAEQAVTLLAIDAALWWDVLEDDFDLVMHLHAALGRALAARGALDLVPGAPQAIDGPEVQPGDAVGQLLRLHRVPMLRPFGVAVLAALVRGEPRELRFAPGEALLRAGAAADRLLVIARGNVECRPADRAAERAGPGAVLGGNAALSGLAQDCDAVAVTPVAAIGIDPRRLWDVAEDHFHVARALLAQAARRLVQCDAVDAPAGPPAGGWPRGEELT